MTDAYTEYSAYRDGERAPWFKTDSPRVAEALSRSGHRVTAVTT